MKRRVKFAIASVPAAYGLYHEVMGTTVAEGTGQTVGELVSAGWGRLEIARYFPWTMVNWALILLTVAWFGGLFKSGRKAESAD